MDPVKGHPFLIPFLIHLILGIGVLGVCKDVVVYLNPSAVECSGRVCLLLSLCNTQLLLQCACLQHCL